MIWMFASVVFIAYFTAAVTSSSPFNSYAEISAARKIFPANGSPR